MVYFVDKLDKDDVDGLYINANPSVILVKEIVPNRIGITVHEIGHHVEYNLYCDKKGYHNEPAHGYHWKLAKERMITWLRNNVSNRVNWYPCFRAVLKRDDMINFKL